MDTAVTATLIMDVAAAAEANPAVTAPAAASAASVKVAAAMASDSTGQEPEDEEPAGLEIGDCIFCKNHAETLEENIKHMTSVHR